MLEEEERKYKLYSMLPVFKKNIDRSISIVKEAIKTNKDWICCISGGKDSTVLLDICVKSGWMGDLFHFFYQETPEENTNLCHNLSKRYGLKIKTLKVPGAFDIYDKIGFFIFAQTNQQIKMKNKMLREYKSKINEFCIENNIYGQFWGLRKGESRQRSMALSIKGHTYSTKDRDTITCCPLLYWSSKDVWAYIVKNNLPYLKIYDNSDDREKQRSETTYLAYEGLWNNGQGSSIKRNNNEEYRMLIERYKESRNLF